MARRKRSRRRLVATIAAQLLVCLLLLEVALAVAEPHSYRLRLLLYKPQVAVDYSAIDDVQELLETTIVGYQPFHDFGGFVLNSRGFRTPEFDDEPAPDVTRLVTLGDSFAFSCSGIPFGRFWPPLVKRGLSEQLERPVELINLAMPATGPPFYARMYDLQGSQLDPDLVIVALFVGNDFKVHEALAEDAEDSMQWLHASRVATLIRNAIRIQQADLLPPTAPKELKASRTPDRGGYPSPGYAARYAQVRPQMSRERLLQAEARRMWICDRTRARDFDTAFRRVTQILDGLWSRFEAQDVPALIVVIPDRFQVNASDRRAVLEQTGRSATDFDWEQPQRMLTGFFTQRGIARLDLLEDFRAAPNAFELYSPGDTHWSPQGCELAAERIVAWLEQHPDLLPP